MTYVQPYVQVVVMSEFGIASASWQWAHRCAFKRWSVSRLSASNPLLFGTSKSRMEHQSRSSQVSTGPIYLSVPVAAVAPAIPSWKITWLRAWATHPLRQAPPAGTRAFSQLSQGFSSFSHRSRSITATGDLFSGNCGALALRCIEVPFSTPGKSLRVSCGSAKGPASTV